VGDSERSFTGNTAAHAGGILTVNLLTLAGARVFGNTPDDCVR
jgi:hypothetical protein